MKLKTSLLNRGIILNDLKRYYWLAALYFISLFFAIPLQIIMRIPYLDNMHVPYTLGRMVFNDNVFVYLFILVVPVLLAVLLFNYLQSKNPSDMIHSLPIKRRTLFASHVFVGVCFLTIPVLMIGFITWILNVTYSLQLYYASYDIITWVSTTIIMNITLFMTAAVIGTITGVSVVHAVLTYILLFLPIGLMSLVLYNMQIFLYGFSWTFYNLHSNTILMFTSPIYRLLNLHNNPIGFREAIFYLFASLVLGILGMYLYERRSLERNLQPIVYRKLSYVFKYGATFSFMLLAGLYFGRQQGELSWILFGYVTASLLGYYIAEAILQKSVRIFNRKTIKGYGIFVLVTILLLLSVSLDVFGYETRIPDRADIKGVYYGHFHMGWQNDRFVYRTDENIDRIMQFHKQLIQDRDINKQIGNNRPFNRNMIDITIIYELRNGKRIPRTYSGIDITRYEGLVKDIYESLEHKHMYYDIFHVDPQQVSSIDLRSYEVDKQLSITNHEEIREVIEILQKEITMADYYTLMRDRRYWGSIEMVLKEDITRENDFVVTSFRRGPSRYIAHVAWSKNFKLFDEWLQAKGYFEMARLTGEDIHKVVVGRVYSHEDIDNFSRNINSSDKFISHDRDIIEISLQNSSDRWGNDVFPRYVVGYYNHLGNEITIGSFDEKQVPQFIRDFLGDN